MDSRIREAFEVVRQYVISEEKKSNYFACVSLDLIEGALLTVNPEPCEDARAFAKNIYMDVCERVEKDGYVAAGFIETYAEEIAAYASQVADKRAEELRKLRDACEPFRNAFAEHGAYQYKDVTPEVARITDQNVITPRGINMGDFRRLSEALAATEPKP